MPENGNRFTPFGVIDRYLWEVGIGWPSFNADRILEKLEAEGYAIVDVISSDESEKA